MLQLLVTIPFPVWDFDFRFIHAILGGWLSLEQLGMGVARENFLQHIAFGSEISRNQTPALCYQNAGDTMADFLSVKLVHYRFILSFETQMPKNHFLQ